MGIGIIGSNQAEITPFQRQVFEAEQARKAEIKENRMQEARGGASGGRQRNAMGGGSGGSKKETVRYESRGERKDDEDVLEVF